MLNKLKSEKGITGIDLSVSLIVITLFISIIVSLSMNVSTSLLSKKSLEIATNCMTAIMEKVDSMDYDKVEVTDGFETITRVGDYGATINFKNEIKGILNEKDEEGNFKYDILTVELKVEDYVPENIKTEAEEKNKKVASLTKKVTVIINYKTNNKNEPPIEVTRVKSRYNIDLTESITY